MKSEPFTKQTPTNEAAPPPLANARRRAKYSLHFLICARPPKIFSIKEKSILLGSALNEQAAGLASILCSGAAEFPSHPPSAAPSLGLANFLAELKLKNTSRLVFNIFAMIYFIFEIVPLFLSYFFFQNTLNVHQTSTIIRK